MTDKIKCEGKKQKFFSVFVGSVIGFLNGFLGGGGGMVCVPMLQKHLKLTTKKAHATAIAVIFPLSFLSSCVYVFNGGIETNSLIFVTLGVVLGGVVGSVLLKYLPEKLIGFIFAFLMIFAGVKMVLWIT